MRSIKDLGLILEQPKSQLPPYIKRLFQFLNDAKKESRTRAALLDKIKEFAPYMNIPEGYELFLLELFLLNYRKDGDYSNLTKDNFVDPRAMKGKTITNPKAHLYTTAQIPFKGSNIQGFWDRDNKGEHQYIVMSYGWYPVYVYKNNRWYEIINRYSSSTGRQMSNANPVEWSDELVSNVTRLTQDEMRALIRGKSHDEVLQMKLDTLKKKESEFQKKRMATVAAGGWDWWMDHREAPIKIKYKIKGIEVEGDKATVEIDIHDVLKRDENTKLAVRTPENYLKGELEGVNKEFVEKKLIPDLKRKFQEYFSHRTTYDSDIPETLNVKFKFNHLRQ